MRVGSLFSGIGGLDLGLERAGMEIAWQVEVDEWCTRILERHWPHVARFRDVRNCHGVKACSVDNSRGGGHLQQDRGITAKSNQNGQEDRVSCAAGSCLPYVDLICGGFPCQPVSHAGRRMGESDSRWLWPEFYRIICEVRPRWVLAENVPGLLSMDSGRLFGGILRDLSEAGYDAVWFVLSAADVGAPHLRERVFIVAHAEGAGTWLDSGGGNNRGRATAESQSESSKGRCRSDVGTGSSGESPLAHAVIGGNGTKIVSQEIDRQDAARPTSRIGRPDWWTTEPDVGRVASRVPSRVDRLRGLGNAVVPQVAEVIGRWIMTAEAK